MREDLEPAGDVPTAQAREAGPPGRIGEQVGPRGEAPEPVAGVPPEVLADGGDVCQGPVGVEPLREPGIAEVDERDQRLRDRRGLGECLPPARLAHRILGEELVPDDALHPA